MPRADAEPPTHKPDRDREVYLARAAAQYHCGEHRLPASYSTKKSNCIGTETTRAAGWLLRQFHAIEIGRALREHNVTVSELIKVLVDVMRSTKTRASDRMMAVGWLRRFQSIGAMSFPDLDQAAAEKAVTGALTGPGEREADPFITLPARKVSG